MAVSLPSAVVPRVDSYPFAPFGGALFAVILYALAQALTPSAPVMWLRWIAAMLLAWWLPGALLVRLWRLPRLGAPAAVVLALGLGWCWLLLGMLLIHLWPGQISPWAVGALFGAGALALAAAGSGALPERAQRSEWALLAGLLLLGALLRLPGLGYHEFHYDEMLVLSRASEAIRGQDDAFARHTKGPGELAVAALVYAVQGTADETTARLPFALAGVAAVGALGLLGRRLFNGEAGAWAGVWAGALLAFNGFALGLSRLVQYQPVVLLLSVLAVLAMGEFSREGEVRWLAAGALLCTGGLLMHYEFALLAPALLVLLAVGRRRTQQRRAVRAVAFISTLLGALVVGGFYLQSISHPYFATTRSYLGSRWGQLGLTFNAPFFVEVGTFYNSYYYLMGLLLLAAGGLVLGRRRWRSPAALLVLWFAPALFIYMALVQFPGTHFYLLMPSLCLLAALPLAALTGPGQPAWRRAGSGAAILLWLAVGAGYLYLLFFRQQPEYLMNYQTERVGFYWAPYGENVPAKPRFGFPIHAGWKTLGVLSEWHYLNGTYASNERSRHLRWYLGDFERVGWDEQPDYIFVARDLQEPDLEYDEERLEEYRHAGEITVRGEPRIAIYTRTDAPAVFTSYAAEPFEALFTGVVPTFREWPDPAAQARNVALGDGLALAQGGFAPVRSGRGDLLHVYLIWNVSAPPSADYKLFVHLADAAGRPLAQWDALPGLNTARTSTWQPGAPFQDHALLPLPDDLPAGEYQVLVGLYDPESGERLGGRAVQLGELSLPVL